MVRRRRPTFQTQVLNLKWLYFPPSRESHVSRMSNQQMQKCGTYARYHSVRYLRLREQSGRVVELLVPVPHFRG